MKILAKKWWMAMAVAVAMMITGVGAIGNSVWAEENATEESSDSSETSQGSSKGGTSISISPVSKILSLEAAHEYEDSFRVSNSGDGEMNFEVYAAPYSYTQATEGADYTLGFSHENKFTQISRWVKFLDSDGNWVDKTVYTAGPNSTVEVHYKITTPDSIPAGGQYAVLFAHVLTASATTSGINVEASPGLVIYGRKSGGGEILDGQVWDLQIKDTLEKDGKAKNIINASARLSNTGNVDYMGKGTLKVTGLFGRVYYETEEMQGKISVIPESEMVLKESWEDTPFLGIFNVEWTVTAPAITDEIYKISTTVVIFPPILIVFAILLLTIIIVWIIIIIRKRRERRAKFMV